MINLKRVLSIILSVNFLFISTLPLLTLAEEDYCAKNSKGGYIHADCANNELLKVGLYKTEDYVDVENLGNFGDEERYAFNFRALDKVFEKKKLISDKNLKNQYNSLEESCEALTNIWNKNNICYIITTSLIGAITGLFSFKTSKNKINPDQSSQSLKQSTAGHSNCRAFSTFMGSLIGGLASIIGLKIKSIKDKQDSNICKQKRELLNKIVEINKSNERNAIMLNLLLNELEHPQNIDFDMISFAVWNENNMINFHWDPKSAEINYTKEELESFPEKFKEVASKIRENLEENQKLEIYNVKPQDNVFTKNNFINSSNKLDN